MLLYVCWTRHYSLQICYVPLCYDQAWVDRYGFSSENSSAKVILLLDNSKTLKTPLAFENDTTISLSFFFHLSLQQLKAKFADRKLCALYFKVTCSWGKTIKFLHQCLFSNAGLHYTYT